MALKYGGGLWIWIGWYMGREEGGGTGRTEGGGGCERMGSEEAMLGIDESILCNKE